MKKNTLKIALAASAMTLFFAGCGDDLLYSQDGNQFTTVTALNPDDCSDSTEGSMAFVKSKATMYVCSEGEWIAMNDHEAIQYRCESKELKDKSGIAIICDGSDTIGVVYNGKDGKDGTNGKNGTNGSNGTNGDNGDNGKDADMDKIQKDIDAKLSSASAQIQKDIDSKMSSASAKNQKDVDDAIKGLSSASAKNEKDINDKLSSASAKNEKDLNDKLSSASREIDEKFDDAYSSLSAELEDKKCEIVNTERNNEKAIITVTIRCGEAETKMEIPFTPVNENLAKARSMLSCVSRCRPTRKQKLTTSMKKSGRTSRVATMQNLP